MLSSELLCLFALQHMDHHMPLKCVFSLQCPRTCMHLYTCTSVHTRMHTRAITCLCPCLHWICISLYSRVGNNVLSSERLHVCLLGVCGWHMCPRACAVYTIHVSDSTSLSCVTHTCTPVSCCSRINSLIHVPLSLLLL